MKLKSFKVTIIILILFFGIGGIMQAQGVYSNNNNTVTPSSSNSVNNGGTNNSGGLFRAMPDPNDTGDGKDPAPGDNSDTPIGGGVLILSLLSGGYALIKRNVRNRHED